MTGIIINDPWNLERKGVNKMSSRWCPGVTVHVWIKGNKSIGIIQYEAWEQNMVRV